MNPKFLILTLVIAGSLGGIAYFSAQETAYKLLDASELAANPTPYQDDNLRVRGFVKLGSLVREGKAARFDLELDNRTIPVYFTGETLLPDAFKEGARARVDGKWKNGVLESNHVEAKCASKYEAGYAEEGSINKSGEKY
jgi:cytochrome c-type biogenesis protein CcmE